MLARPGNGRFDNIGMNPGETTGSGGQRSRGSAAPQVSAPENFGKFNSAPLAQIRRDVKSGDEAQQMAYQFSTGTLARAPRGNRRKEKLSVVHESTPRISEDRPAAVHPRWAITTPFFAPSRRSATARDNAI
jgi:hypothetical protein